MTRSIRHGTALTSTTHTSIRPTVATFKADSEREPNRCFIKIEECRKALLYFCCITINKNRRGDSAIWASSHTFERRASLNYARPRTKNAEGHPLGIFVKLLANLLWNIVGYRINLPVASTLVT